MIKYTPLTKIKTHSKDYANLNIHVKYKKIIQSILEIIQDFDTFKCVEKILLFGSCAREESIKGSDIDIMVVTETELPERIKSEWRREIYNRLATENIDIIFYTTELFEHGTTVFIKNVKRDAITLYSKERSVY